MFLVFRKLTRLVVFFRTIIRFSNAFWGKFFFNRTNLSPGRSCYCISTLDISRLIGNFRFQCLTHTHQLAIDFQLFMVAMALMYLLRNSKVVGMSIIAAAMSASTLIRYQAVKNNDLATVVYFGSE